MRLDEGDIQLGQVLRCDRLVVRKRGAEHSAPVQLHFFHQGIAQALGDTAIAEPAENRTYPVRSVAVAS